MYVINRINFADPATADTTVLSERYDGFEDAYEGAFVLASNECDERTDRSGATHFYPAEREEDCAIDVMFYYDFIPEKVYTISTYVVVEADE